MAKLMGIDYGTRRIGVALSDVQGTIAFPHTVFQHNKETEGDLVALAKKEGIQAIVFGDSKTHHGTDNPIMASMRVFALTLGTKTGLPIVFEPEFMTSEQAMRTVGENNMIDASAAALILQSYIDRTQNHERN